MIAFRSCLISSIYVRCGLPLGRLTFLRYSASASLAGVSGCSLMRWPSQLRRRLCIVVLHSSVLVLVCSSMLVIFLGQCMPRIFLRYLLWKVFACIFQFFGEGPRFAVVEENTRNICIESSDFYCVADFSAVKNLVQCFERIYCKNFSAVDVLLRA